MSEFSLKSFITDIAVSRFDGNERKMVAVMNELTDILFGNLIDFCHAKSSILILLPTQ